jgi:hypothetical protein
VSLITIKAPISATFPQFNNQPISIEYDGKEMASLEQGEGNTYLVMDDKGNVVTVLNERNRSVNKYTFEDAVYGFIQFMFLGVKLKGHGMKGKGFSGNHDKDAISSVQQQKIVETVLRDHNIELKV